VFSERWRYCFWLDDRNLAVLEAQKANIQSGIDQLVELRAKVLVEAGKVELKKEVGIGDVVIEK